MRDGFTTGTYVSGAGHAALVVWLLAGWGLSHETEPFEVTNVSVVTGAEFAALVAATTPDPLTSLDPAPVAPDIDDAPSPDLPTPPDPAVTPQPDLTPPPPPAEEAAPPAPPEPVPPPAEVTDAAPDQPQPAPTELAGAPDLPPSLRPQPRPATRIAPEAVAPPPPEAEIAPEVAEAAEPAPSEEPAELVEEEVNPTAPEETATEIVTEAETPSGAVTTSLRPAARPAPPPQPATETTASSDNVADDVAAALAEAASSDNAAPAANPGPPMTGAERDAFRVSVQGCWVVDPGSEAARVEVTVVFELGRDGRVQGDVRMLTNTGGSDAAVRSAFDAARRAILRCQADGFPLPADKYEQWRLVEMTFNPEQMRIR